ncbi:PLPL9 phospholipase, partial [Polyodon spathula]|nr:PLPL9 phospholipase [Polyodon spathula]
MGRQTDRQECWVLCDRCLLFSPQLCRLLIAKGCNVNYLSQSGETPLHIMVRRKRFGAAMVLLTHGAQSNAKGENGDTPLHLAMKVQDGDMRPRERAPPHSVTPRESTPTQCDPAREHPHTV